MEKEKEKKYTGTERRHFKRIPFSFHAHFVPCGNDKTKLVKGGFPGYSYCNDISTDGIQLQFHQKPKLEEYLKLQLTLPKYKDKQVVHALGQVIWSQYDEKEETYSAGIRFVDLEENTKKNLEDFISKSIKDMII